MTKRRSMRSEGDTHGEGGVCMVGCVRGQGACMAGAVCMVGGGACMVGCVCKGACMAGETATAADGTHPTGRHSC